METNYKEALVEVLEILNFLDTEERKKIPTDLINFFEEHKSKTYKPNIQYKEDINNLQLKDKTRQILAGLYLDYLCTDENEKKEYEKILKNQKYKYEENLKENYKGKNLFEDIKYVPVSSNEQITVIKKENIFTKILKKLKSLFKK